MTKLLPSSYAPLLADLKARVRAAQVKAAVSVNRELMLLYWHIGQEILRTQKAEGWGAKVVERLAKDLAAEFPEMGGFSARNLKYMLAFASAWEPIEIVQQPVAQLGDAPAGTQIGPQAVGQSHGSIVQRPVAQIVSQPVTQFTDAPPEPLALLPWSTNLILLHKLKDPATRLWYARKTLENGWSRAVLTVQIESRLHERSGKAITNFERTLPPAQSDMAREALKDPYTFDFLTLGEAAHERDLERGLVGHVQQLLLEMGAGFAFVGRQVQVEVGDEDFYLDLLFYHLRLRCFVVVDLKMKPFEPEFAGKIHPVRYTVHVLLRLCPQKRQRRQLLHRIHTRPTSTCATARGRVGAIHATPLARRTHLLRIVPRSKRCYPTREVSENRVGQALPQSETARLSHGVNFYLSAVDDLMRHEDDAATIGLLLCKDAKNRVKVEYALRDVRKPIGVAEWQTRLVDALPKKLQGALPTIADIERELNGPRVLRAKAKV